MDELIELLKPSWGAEKWILEGWNQLTSDEKQLIKNRMDELFCDGLPFELKADKLLYIYTFSLLAQLEVLAIQIPLKFESKISSIESKERMHLQLLDEIFHGLVFTKIVYMLCAPYATPPQYSSNIESLCNFIRNEHCPKIAILLLNLIGEGWIEEIFYSLHRCGIAPKVFTIILEDEHRHVCEADLYQDIGMPDIKEVKPKVAYLEEQLINNVFMQYNYMVSICTLLGFDGVADFTQSLNKKHIQQLKKINLEPSEHWKLFMQIEGNLFPKMKHYNASNQEIEMTSTRQVLMTQWDDPSDPTMTGQFNLNVSCLEFFNKKFPAETITCLMLQAISLGLSSTRSFRNYLSFKKIYQSKEAYVALVVKLPDCGDQLSTIIFENCHELGFSELALKIRALMKMMTYCYKKREFLEKTHPYLKNIRSEMWTNFNNNTYTSPILGTPFVSVSNIGFCGYSQSMSPLRSNETMKFTLMEIERKPIWDKETQSFKPEDMLPISISADHRIFDGNLPVPKMVNEYFKVVFAKMLQDKPDLNQSQAQPNSFEKLVEHLISSNIEMAYKALVFLQTCWCDFLSLEELFQNQELHETQLDVFY